MMFSILRKNKIKLIENIIKNIKKKNNNKENKNGVNQKENKKNIKNISFDSLRNSINYK